MIRRLIYVLPLILSACGGGESGRPEVSRAGDYTAHGISYTQFRAHYSDDDMTLVQKRFIMLDRDNNGVLSEGEYSFY